MLRERGDREGAEQLRSSTLPGLLQQVRTPEDTDETLNARLEAIFATEEERVANAAVLAELLVPLLAANGAAPFASVSAAMAPASVRPTPPEQPLAKSPAAAAPPRPPAPAGIADFIDAMIEQERSAPPPHHGSPQRRAS